MTPTLAIVLSLWLPAVAEGEGGANVEAKQRNVVVADGADPVGTSIESWYEKNLAAFEAKDVAAIMALRTEDFHTETPDGKVNTRADMEERTRRFLDRIDTWVLQDFKIGKIQVTGDLASADVNQRTVRMQRYPDGSLHKVDARVVQRETWKRTAGGWKLHKVDDIRDHVTLVDDAPVER